MRFARCFVAAVLVGLGAGCARGGASQSIAGAPTSVPMSAPAGNLRRYDDPFSYCRAVGTIDQPDARYIGPNPPPAVIAGLIKSLGVGPSDTRSEALARGSYWRCMDGAVYACTVGANLPCESRADTSRTPTKGEQQYCAANPGSGFIPMYVTGHATIYDWHCEGAEPVAGRQLSEVDARGYIAGIWYRIPALSQ